MGGKNTVADGVRPIFLPPGLGVSSVLVVSAAAVAIADIIDPSTDGPADASDGGPTVRILTFFPVHCGEVQ